MLSCNQCVYFLSGSMPAALKAEVLLYGKSVEPAFTTTAIRLPQLEALFVTPEKGTAMNPDHKSIRLLYIYKHKSVLFLKSEMTAGLLNQVTEGFFFSFSQAMSESSGVALIQGTLKYIFRREEEKHFS